MNLDTLLSSYIYQKILVCKYYGSIEEIQIVEKNNCESTLSMNINREIAWDYPNGFLYSDKFIVSQPLYKNNSQCGGKENKYFRYSFENPPVYGSGNIFEKYIDENGNEMIGPEVLNTDIGFKYRFKSEIIGNNNLNGWIQSSDFPICKGNFVQEYMGIGVGIIIILGIVFFGIKKIFQKN